MLACVGILPTILDTSGTHWNDLEPIRPYQNRPGFPLSYNKFTCSGDFWGVLACVGIIPTIGCYWKKLEPPGTYTTLYEPSWIVLDVPCPQYLKCIAALVCSYPPLSYNTFTCSGDLWGVLACVGILPAILDTIATYWNHLEPIRPL